MKLQSYIIFLLIFGILPDIFLWDVVLQDTVLWWKIAVCLPTVAVLVFLVMIAAVIRYSDSVRAYSYAMFIFELPKFVLSLFWLIGRKALGLPMPLTAGISLGLAAGVGLFFLYLIFYVSRHLKVHAESLSFDRLPETFDGFRICQLCDLHLGSFGKTSAYVRRIIDATLSQHPDIILFTGDLVNFESSEAQPFLKELSRLAAPMGVFAVRGNHDYLLHGHHDEQERQEDMNRLLAMEQGLGWQVLRNEHALVHRGDGTLAVVGVDNISANPFFNKADGDFSRALSGLPDGIFKILLSHDPSHWRAEVVPEGNVSLTLSGHTHGLRYKLAGRHISHWHLPESAGTYTEKDQILHVSKGLGSAFAFRIGGFPNIDLITLQRKSQA